MPFFLGDLKLDNMYIGETKINGVFLGETPLLPSQPPEEQGKNIFKTGWELGAYEWTTGNKIDVREFIRSIDLLEVEPNTNYVGSTNIGQPNNAIYFRADKSFISYDREGTIGTRGYYVTPPDCYYIGLNFNQRKIVAETITWTQVEKGTVATEYEPPVM